MQQADKGVQEQKWLGSEGDPIGTEQIPEFWLML